MSRVKKLIASIIIILMFLRLPDSEAKASDSADNFISAAINSNYPLINSVHADCTGLYTIFSPCHTTHLNVTDLNGDGTLDIYETVSPEPSLLDDEDQTLPWNNDSEPPQVGFLIPILHF